MLTSRERYELELAHIKARREDARKRAENRTDVEARWPVTMALIDHLFEQQVVA